MFNLFIIIDITYLNEELKKLIEYAKLNFKDNIHFLYYSDNDSLSDHLKCVELEISRSFRNTNKFCIVIIDIDHFKSINDQYGHAVGDKVLKTLSCFFKKNLRKTDIIGRYGGEEFVIIFPDTSKESTFYILNKLKEQFSHIKHRYQNLEFYVTFSAGISSFPEQNNPSELFEQADKFLYQAKNSGRNTISF